MRRGFWFVAGAGAGVYVMNRARRAAEMFTSEGLRDRLGALDVGARLFREEYAEARAEKETELRERYGLLPDMRPQLQARAGFETVAARPPQPTEQARAGFETVAARPPRPTETEGTH